MALTPPAEIAQIQEANTAVLPSSDQLNDQFLRAGAMRYGMNQAKHIQDQKDIEAKLSQLDINSADVWDVDQPEIYKQIAEWQKQVVANPKLLSPDPKDAQSMMDYTNFIGQRDKILGAINKSKIDRAIYGEQQKYLANPTNQQADYGTQEDKDVLEGFKTGGLQRNWNGFAPRDLFNQHQFIVDTQAYVGKGDKYDTEVATGVGNENKKISVTATDPIKIGKAIDAGLTDKEGKRALGTYSHALQLAIQNPDNPDLNPTITIYDLNQKRGKDGKIVVKGEKKLADGVSAKEWIANYVVPANDISDYQQGLEGARTSLSAGATDEKAKGDIWPVKYANDVLSGTVQGAKWAEDFSTTDGERKTIPNSKHLYSPAPAEWYEKVSNPNYDPESGVSQDNPKTISRKISGTITKNGKIYKVYDDVLTADGKFAVNDVVSPKNEIKNIWLEMIVPNTTSAEANKEAEKLWKDNPEEAKKLGAPKPLGYSNSTGTTQFKVNGVIYNIPNDKVESFKKAKGIK